MADFVVTATFQDNLSDGANAAATALQNAATAADNLTVSNPKAGPSATALSNRFDPATAAANKLQRALQQLQQATATMDAAVASGTATAAQRDAVVGSLSTKVQALTAATAANAPATNAMTSGNLAAANAASTAATAHAGFTRELIVLGDEVLNGNFGRIPGSMLVLSERSATLSSAIGGLVSSALNPFVIAGAATVGALAALGIAYETNQEQLLGLQAALSATRDDYASMGVEAQNAARAAAAISGFSVADESAGAKTITAVPSFTGSQQQLQNLLLTAGNLATVMGETLPQAATTLAQAMENPGKVADDLVNNHFRGMSQALADQITLQAQAGDKAGAFATVLGVLQTTTAGASTTFQTDLQKALTGLSNAFTATGADGRSFASVLGKTITEAAASAINALAGLVGYIENFREQAATGPAGQGATINGATITPGLAGNVIANPTTGDLGIFQVDPKTAANPGYGVASFDPTDPTQNIYGGLQLLQAYIKADGGVNGGLAQFGGFGTNVGAASNYIAKVNSADTSVLNNAQIQVGSQTMTTAQAIQFWGQALGLDQATIDLGMRVATVESHGQQFATALNAGSTAGTIAQPAVEENLPIPPIPPTGADLATATATGVVNRPTNLEDAGTSLADHSGIQAAQYAQIAANISTAQKALAAYSVQGVTAGAAVDKLTQYLQQQNLALYNASPVLTQLARTTVQQIDANTQLADAYQQGGEAVVQATAANQAYQEALKQAAPGTQQFVTLLQAYTQANLAVAASQQGLQASKDINSQQQQLALLQEQQQTLSESYTVRQQDLAAFQEEQKIAQSMPDITEQQKQALIDNAQQVASITAEYQRQQNAVNEIGNAVENAADQIGQAISSAFVSGQGAAVNWGNVTRAIIASVVEELAKLAVINPILNSLFGENKTTIGDVAGVLGSAVGGSASSGSTSGFSLGTLLQGGGLLFNGGSLFGIGGGAGGSSLLSSLGLSGIGNSVTSFLGTSLGIGGLSDLAASQATAALGAGVAGPVLTSAGAASAGGALTIGGLLSGAGLGFGAGDLLNSLIGGNSAGGTVGSGLGAVAGTLIGRPIGGLLGGLLGGAGGGLIGPNPPSTYSQETINTAGGLLNYTGQSAQGMDDSSEVANLTSQIAQMDQFFQQYGIGIAKQNSYVQFGTNTPGGYVDPSKYSDLYTPNVTGQNAFQQFTYGSSDPNIERLLQNNNFSNLQDMETAIQNLETFVNQTMPALQALGNSPTQTGSLTSTLNNLNSEFSSAISEAQSLGLATDGLSQAWASATQQATDAATAPITAEDQQFQASYLSAYASVTGNPQDQETSDLYAFDTSATQQEQQLHDQLVGIYGDSYASTADYASQMAQLEKSLGEQRLAIQQQYNDKLTATALQGVQSLQSYVTQLQTGSTSPLSPDAQYQLTENQFDSQASAALGGSWTAYQSIEQYASAFLQASQAYNGSGAQYANDYQQVLGVLGSLGSMTPDTLTNAVLQSTIQSQTDQLVAALQSVGTRVAAVEIAIKQGSSAPSRIQ